MGLQEASVKKQASQFQQPVLISADASVILKGTTQPSCLSGSTGDARHRPVPIFRRRKATAPGNPERAFPVPRSACCVDLHLQPRSGHDGQNPLLAVEAQSLHTEGEPPPFGALEM